MESRALERTVAFTDAAVAIALTLLVLPLVDVAQAAGGAPLRDTIREHDDDVLAFVISFFVVMLFWRVHRRLFAPVRRLDEGLVTLNSLWLLGVVFLPVPTAVLTFQEEGGAATLYLGNLLYVALCGLALSVWVWRRPELRHPEQAETVRRQLRREALVIATVAVAMVASRWWGGAALLLLLAVPVAQLLTTRRAGRRT